MYILELKDIESGYDGKSIIRGITFTPSEFPYMCCLTTTDGVNHTFQDKCRNTGTVKEADPSGWQKSHRS
jgi:hypothetical protein